MSSRVGDAAPAVVGLAFQPSTSAPMGERPPMTVRTAGLATTVPLAWSRAFPATPVQTGEARRFLSGILSDFPAADDAILCLSELAANATVHSHSRKPGGHFTVRAQIRPGERLRVEVQDQGGSWTRAGTQPEPSHDWPHGRGLVIVGRLAQDWGRSGDSATGWIVWFEMPYDRPA
jgi:anti-sigma regulatory factor (Ser/Thr protein kinase)